MKKIISTTMLLFILFSMPQIFTMNKEQAFEECVETCENNMNNFIQTYQYECKGSLFNRLQCFKKGILAVHKFDECSNRCFKAFDNEDNK